MTAQLGFEIMDLHRGAAIEALKHVAPTPRRAVNTQWGSGSNNGGKLGVTA